MRDQIKNKAEALFISYGIKSITMAQIAASLGISKKTIYQYYRDKEELVALAVKSILDRCKYCLSSDYSNTDDPIKHVFSAMEAMRELWTNMNPVIVSDLQKYHPNIYKEINQFKRNFLYDNIKANLQEGINRKLYRDDLDVEIITRLRIETAMLPFNRDVFPNNFQSLLKIEESLTEHFLHGIVTPLGYRKITKYKNQFQKKANAK